MATSQMLQHLLSLMCKGNREKDLAMVIRFSYFIFIKLNVEATRKEE